MCREGAGFVAACGGENYFSLKTGFGQELTFFAAFG